MKQLKVALPDDLRSKLEQLAETEGVSLAEEVRRRLEQSFAADVEKGPTRDLADAVFSLAGLIRLATGHDWFSHPASHLALRYALTARLQRLRPKGDRVFKPEELPAERLVNTEDPETIGLALELTDFQTPKLDRRTLEKLYRETIDELLVRYPNLKIRS